MALRCNLCEEPLTLHCDDVCGWLICVNRSCDAMVYDMDRGWLLMRDGVVQTTMDG